LQFIYNGGQGGSGVVKITVPNARYPGIQYTGSNVVISNPPSAPGNTVINFYSSGTFRS
jgi:hypothetical protein